MFTHKKQSPILYDSDLIKSTLGEVKADILIKNVKNVDVHTGEIYEANMLVKNGKVACITSETLKDELASEVLDGEGLYLVPGFIESHIHIESSLVGVTEFAKAVIPHGTTAVIADPHEIGNVSGLNGIKLFIEESRKLPLKIFFEIPSCVPAAPGLDSSGAVIGPKEVKKLLKYPEIIGLGEVMNFVGVLHQNKDLIEKIVIVQKAGKIVDGHAPGLKALELCAYIASGIKSDHEATTEDEAIERLRKGMYLMMREGSLARDLATLAKPIVKMKLQTRRCLLATDDRSIADLIRKGHVDYNVNRAIEEGIPFIEAIQMATINPAERFGLDKMIGSISPGKKADFLLISWKEKIKVEKVFINGDLWAENGTLTKDIRSFNYPIPAINTIRLKRRVTSEDLTIKHDRDKTVKVRVLKAWDGSLYTKQLIEDLTVEDKIVKPDHEKDIALVAVVERHKGTGEIGKGFISGFGIQKGALATSMAHDSHNIVVVGVNPNDMAIAISQIHKMGGGMVVVDEKVKAYLPLPVGGIVSDKPGPEVSPMIETLKQEAAKIGCVLNEPFITLSFMSLPVIPEIKVTNKGVVDVLKHKIVSPVIE